jgi:hypothetical protein
VSHLVRRRLGIIALLCVTPLLTAASSDPRGDVTACGTGKAVTGAVADLVRVDAYADELGTAAVWRLRFARPIPVPDPDGSPLRIDVLVRDPRLAPVTRGDERGMNRIVRWVDASADQPIDVIWLAREGHTAFNPPVIQGRTIELRVPGRILLGEASNGTESVARARWSVLVRDGGACDRLGDRPRLRLRQAPSPAVTPTVAGSPTDTSSRPEAVSSWAVLAGVLAVILAVGITAVWRGRTT